MFKRCTKCILPENYPGIIFDEQGICNYCNSFVVKDKKTFLGDDALKKEIQNYLKKYSNRNMNYDCVLGLSGGRDSTYLLYYLVKKLNLRVIAYHIDNGFIPEQTKINIKNATDLLHVKLVVEKIDNLEKCIKHHMQTWMDKPSLPLIESLCVGCRYGHFKGLPDFAKKNRIPIFISGSTPTAEKIIYRFNYLKLKPGKKGQMQIFLGIIRYMLANPKIFFNGTCLITQIQEYFYFYDIFGKFKSKLGMKTKILRLDPFVKYTRWEEKVVVSTIQNKLNWKKNSQIGSTWRGDCDIALLKLYLYKKILGFNDKEDGLSNLIRDRQITRDEALERLKEEEQISDELIKSIVSKISIDFNDLQIALSKIQK